MEEPAILDMGISKVREKNIIGVTLESRYST